MIKRSYGTGVARRLAERMAELEARVVDAELRLANTVRHGVVTDVDPQKQLVRLKIGKDADGTDQKGPWVPYGQHAGALKFHSPPVVGQNMTSLCASGDPEQAVAIPFTWNTANPAPGTTADHVMTYLSQINITMADGKVVATIPDTTIMVDADHAIQISSAGIKTTGKLTNKLDGSGAEKVIDSSHKHTGVVSGSDTTQEPV